LVLTSAPTAILVFCRVCRHPFCLERRYLTDRFWCITRNWFSASVPLINIFIYFVFLGLHCSWWICLFIYFVFLGFTLQLVDMFDACSSWWTQGVGHGSSDMATAIAYAQGRYACSSMSSIFISSTTLCALGSVFHG
jgi:hypothetical protein